MKRVAIIVIGLLAFFSISFVIAEGQGWMQEDFVSSQFEMVKRSTAGKVGVFVAVVGVLMIDLLLPVPSSIVMVLAGVFLNVWVGALASFVGAMLAALIGYYGCRLGGTTVFNKLVGSNDLQRVEAWFEDYGIAAIIISRPVPMLTEILSCLAGLSRVKATHFLLASVAGTAPICLIYAYVGGLYGLEALQSKEGVTAMIWVTVAIPACGWLFTHWVKRMRTGGTASSAPSSLVVWGRLLRLPNIFTVPGDAVAGALIVSSGEFSPTIGWAALAVIPLYLGGLVLNDFFDREEDARERPDRPIPAGHVKPATALVAGFLMLVAGIAIAFVLCSIEAGYVALGIAVAVLSYDAGGRKIPLVGPALMGACRAGSVILGAYAVGVPQGMAIQIAAITWAYTVAITMVAARETEATPPKYLVHLPGLFLGMVALAVYRASDSPDALPAVALLVWAMTEAFMGSRAVAMAKLPVPPFIGRLIQIMLTVQAAWVVLAVASNRSVTLICLAVFIVLRLAAKWSSKQFYGS